jgi:hypothetical protein
VRGGGEAAHVQADLGDDDVRGDAADAGDLIQPLGRQRERGDLRLDVGLEGGDVGADRIHAVQHRGQQERVMSVKWPVNASVSWPSLARMRVRASCASALGSRSPATSASSIARPETPKMSAATTLSLIWASSRSFSTRFFSAVRTPTRSAR